MEKNKWLLFIALLYYSISIISTYRTYNNKISITADATKACDSNLKPLVIKGRVNVGRIITPGYPEEAFYTANASCFWIIDAPEDHYIRIYIDSSNFKLDKDGKAVLYVHENNEKLIEYRKYFNVSKFLESKTNQLHLHFNGVDNPRSPGFELYFEIKKRKNICSEGLLPCNNNKCYNASNKCDQIDNCSDGTDEEHCPLSNLNSSCGQSKVPNSLSMRVVGGEESEPGEWPWMVSLRYKIRSPISHLCGAVLINRMWVLTAAHCFVLRNTSKYELNLGRFNSIVPLYSQEIVRYISKLRIYHDFTFNEMIPSGDLALIKLNAPIPTHNEYVSPVCLPTSLHKVEENSTAYVIGWGNSDHPQNNDLFLKKAAVPIVSQQRCQRSYPGITINYNFICAGKSDGGPDSCDGDSGGPLMIYDLKNDKWVIIGIVSKGAKKCGLKEKPGIYTNINNYLDWIRYIIETE